MSKAMKMTKMMKKWNQSRKRMSRKKAKRLVQRTRAKYLRNQRKRSSRMKARPKYLKMHNEEIIAVSLNQ